MIVVIRLNVLGDNLGSADYRFLWTPNDISVDLYSSENGAWIIYRQTSNISRTLVDSKIVDHSDVVGASPVGAAPTTSSFLITGFNGLSKLQDETRII